ncbi:hypothetical protein [Flavobacterium taihuense]|uniref:Acid shock protein n=1 Tax=Flavobacterium taihuense TaxID=2857508 RepID=A0ABS6XS59_9FLAO|nr:hypothetical protein [Flavobacterium taihuense]MBW4359513.1 hypothetical protein [Flavobacterium taihuense]
MKKLLMLIALLFGTTVMVNAKTVPVKSATVKEVKMTKHPKHKKAKKEQKEAAPTGASTSKTKK